MKYLLTLSILKLYQRLLIHLIPNKYKYKIEHSLQCLNFKHTKHEDR